ncbi:MAG: FHA domain-containing protein, partial [Pyrinomonadaceae bacterium]
MKLSLTIGSGSLVGRTFDLASGFLTIGRSETCTIRFDPATERVASKQHAFIEARADGFYLTDNNSTNGTLVNGHRIETVYKLSSGDEIQFGINGVKATVLLGGAQPDVGAGTDVRQYQLQQFNDLAAR